MVPAGPALPTSPILVDANDPIVTGLGWLGWNAAGIHGGLPRMSLTHGEAMTAFAIKVKLDRNPAVLAAAAPINMLTIRMVPALWSRLLSAIRDNGMAGKTISVMEELHSYIRDCVPLILVGLLDWAPAPPLAAGANVPARVASANIKFLGMASVAQLEVQSGRLATTAPWTVICKLAGAIGGVSTRRADGRRATAASDDGEAGEAHAGTSPRGSRAPGAGGADPPRRRSRHRRGADGHSGGGPALGLARLPVHRDGRVGVARHRRDEISQRRYGSLHARPHTRRPQIRGRPPCTRRATAHCLKADDKAASRSRVPRRRNGAGQQLQFPTRPVTEKMASAPD